MRCRSGRASTLHRSYWVADASVAAVERRGERVRLKLANGFSVPVSRRHLSGLRAAGWLRPERFGGVA